MSICDTLDVMDGGVVIASGTPGQIQQGQHVLDACLGAGHPSSLSTTGGR